jgi:copper(I)-binding protein
MKARILVLAVAAVSILAVCGGGAAPGPITVRDAWARPAVAGPAATGSPMAGMGGSGASATSNGAVYMTIANSASVADRLVKVETAAAATAELHSAAMVNGVMEMRKIDGVDVPANGSVELKPGGFHVMLIGLKADLAVGGTVELTLTFEKAGAVAVEATVRAEAP